MHVPPIDLCVSRSSQFLCASICGGTIYYRSRQWRCDSDKGTKAFSDRARRLRRRSSVKVMTASWTRRYQDAFKNCGLTWTKPATNAANRGAVLDQHWKLVDSSNPARLGDYVSIWISGLGKFTGEVWMYNIPVYGISDTSYLINAVYSGEVETGLFQVNAQIPVSLATGGPNGYPPAWPCGNYQWEVSLGVRGAGGVDRHVEPRPNPCSGQFLRHPRLPMIRYWLGCRVRVVLYSKEISSRTSSSLTRRRSGAFIAST
jgi:hypothetical protein